MPAPDWWTNGDPCPDCGRVHGKCRAHNRAGNPCGRDPAHDQWVCAMHGAKAPQTEAKATERRTMERVTAFLTSYGLDRGVEQHPLEGLLDEVWRSARAVEFLGMLVAELQIPTVTEVEGLAPQDNPWENAVGMDEDGQVLIARAIGYLYGPDHNQELAPHVLVHMWNQERDRHARFCKMAIDAGVAERMVAMAEAQGRAVVRIVMDVLNDPDLALTSEQQEVGRKRAAAALREVARPAALAS